jgi:hypothetical protein
MSIDIAADAQLNATVVRRRLKKQHQKDERIRDGNLGTQTRKRYRDLRREQESNRDEDNKAGVELAKMDLCSRIEKDQATTSNNYPEEWPEEFICHGAKRVM